MLISPVDLENARTYIELEIKTTFIEYKPAGRTTKSHIMAIQHKLVSHSARLEIKKI